MQKRYLQEFKGALLDFYHSGQSVTQLSKEYGVAPATIYKWIDFYSKYIQCFNHLFSSFFFIRE